MCIMSNSSFFWDTVYLVSVVERNFRAEAGYYERLKAFNFY